MEFVASKTEKLSSFLQLFIPSAAVIAHTLGWAQSEAEGCRFEDSKARALRDRMPRRWVCMGTHSRSQEELGKALGVGGTGRQPLIIPRDWRGEGRAGFPEQLTLELTQKLSSWAFRAEEAANAKA